MVIASGTKLYRTESIALFGFDFDDLAAFVIPTVLANAVWKYVSAALWTDGS